MAKIILEQILTITLYLHLVTSESCPKFCHCSSRTMDCQYAALQSINFNLQEDTEVLNLAFNNIYLDNKLFLEVSNIALKTIYLNNNNISVVGPETFKNLIHLRHLYLQNNQLEYIHPSLFETNLNLTTLDLSKNHLNTIYPNTFESNHILLWINVEGNPLNMSSILSSNFRFSPNVVDIEVYKELNPSINSFQSISFLKLLNLKKDSEFSVQQFKSQETMEDNISLESHVFVKLDKSGFHQTDLLIYDSSQKTILSMSNTSILCFCEDISLWFWCYQQKFSCSDSSFMNSNETTRGLTEINFPTSSLQSTTTTSTEISEFDNNQTTVTNNKISTNTTSISESEDNNIIYIAIYVCVGLALCTIVITTIVFVYKRRCKNTADPLPPVRYSQVNNVDPIYAEPYRTNILSRDNTITNPPSYNSAVGTMNRHEQMNSISIDTGKRHRKSFLENRSSTNTMIPVMPSHITKRTNSDNRGTYDTRRYPQGHNLQAVPSSSLTTIRTDNRGRYGSPRQQHRDNKEIMNLVLPSGSESGTSRDNIALPTPHKKAIAAMYRERELDDSD